MNKYKDRKGINLLTIFLVIDLLAVFATLKTSGAVYKADAIGDIDLNIAYYAFRYDMTNDASESYDIDLGEIEPGETKSYKLNIYNRDKDGKKSDTSISYILKIVTTTNLELKYELFFNQHPESTNAQDLIANNEVQAEIQRDKWGTYFYSIVVPEQCISYKNENTDFFYLTITMPEEYKNHPEYQNVIESIKVQIESKQVLNNDIVERGLICREN